MKCRKTRAKVIILTNHNRRNDVMNQSEFEANTAVKPGKTSASKSRLLLVFILIGWESGAGFFNQSQSLVQQTRSKT